VVSGGSFGGTLVSLLLNRLSRGNEARLGRTRVHVVKKRGYAERTLMWITSAVWLEGLSRGNGMG